eukprot:9010343-Pyramimonas_sp.AAC.1
MLGFLTSACRSPAGPELFATVLRKPEGEEAKDASPPLYPHVCVADQVKQSFDPTPIVGFGKASRVVR